MVAGPCASPSTSPTPGWPRAAPPSSSCSPGASRSAARSCATPRATSTEEDEIAVDRKPVGEPEGPRAVYIVNKPAGVVSTAHDTHGRRTIVDLVKGDRRLYPVGRLDAETTGLILLTDDGELAYRLTHPSFEVPEGLPRRRAQPARARGGAAPAARGRRARGRAHRAGEGAAGSRPSELELTIHEGRKRQVRRMLDLVGHRVETLERVAFGPLRLGALPPGGHRRLSRGGGGAAARTPPRGRTARAAD